MSPATRPVLLASAAGSFLLLDTLRVWLPSLSTIYGSAGSTSPYALAGFALAWVLPVVVVAPLAARGAVVPVVAAGLAVLSRVVLQAGVTGDAQLYASCAAAFGMFGWLVAVAARGWPQRAVATGFAIGLAATTLLQLATSTDLTWLPAGLGWALLAVASALLLLGTADSRALPGEGGRAAWFAIGPVLVLAGVITTATGRVEATVQWPPPWWGAALVGVGAAAGVLAALRGGLPGGRWTAAVLVLGGTALADLARDGQALPTWAAIPQALLALALPAALASLATQDNRRHRGVVAYAGLLTFFLLVAVYYVAFDSLLPIPRPALLLAAAAILAATLLSGQRTELVAAGRRPALAAGVLSAVCVVTAFLAAPAEPETSTPDLPLKVMTYNVRYGISAGGRYDPAATAAVIAEQNPDVLLLQEIDRGFLLNGSHDVLADLGRRLGMHVAYNPASEPLFGDAILTRAPLSEVRPVALPAYDIPTRPGVLSGVLAVGGTELVIAVTHLHTDGEGVDVRQVTDVAAEVDLLRRSGRPLLLAGDFNLGPDDPRLAPVLAGLGDGLAGARPLRTSPSTGPRSQIDHVFLSADLAATGVSAPGTTASDHLPVVLTVDRAAR